jgi:aromatic-L-amino-acid/L-tryptophan decarboxylase
MTAPSELPRDVSLDPTDWEEYRRLAHRVMDQSIEHLRTVRDRPVWQPVPDEVKAALAVPLPVEPEGAAGAFDACVRLLLPYATGNTHPRFWGWVHGSGTAGGALAQLLAATMNANVGGRDHGAVYVERQVIAWCRELFGFPATATGLLLSGTSMATLVALAVARNEGAGFDVRSEGLRGGPELLFYAAEEAHASVGKALELLGLGRRALRLVPVGADYRMDLAALVRLLAEDRREGRRPVAVVATAGTVNTGAIDDLAAVADVCREHGLWMHVDGAFGALLRLSPALAPRLDGIERADSLAFDFHKWLHVPYDAGCLLVRRGEAHLAAFSSRHAYLAAAPRGLAGGEPWFCDLGPELSRGFRALPVWFTWKEHGGRRLGEKILENCEQAAYLADRVRGCRELLLAAPVSLNIVCFRFVAGEMDDADRDLLHQDLAADLQEAGIAAPSTTRLRGRTVLRVAITNHRSRRADFDTLIEHVVALGTRRLAGARR